MNSYGAVYTNPRNEDYKSKDAEEQKRRKEVLQNNLALMRSFLGGRDKYGRAIPMDTGAALGVMGGHLLGEAIQRWLNRDPTFSNGNGADSGGKGVNSTADANRMLNPGEYWGDGNETSPEAGQDEVYTPALFNHDAMQNWGAGKQILEDKFLPTPIHSANNYFPTTNFLADNVNQNSFDFEDKWKKGLLSGLG